MCFDNDILHMIMTCLLIIQVVWLELMLKQQHLLLLKNILLIQSHYDESFSFLFNIYIYLLVLHYHISWLIQLFYIVYCLCDELFLLFKKSYKNSCLMMWCCILLLTAYVMLFFPWIYQITRGFNCATLVLLCSLAFAAIVCLFSLYLCIVIYSSHLLGLGW